ncbi:MAG: metallophosphoesterase family protein [Winogradskyella sp.]|uniref:metallophosphoesterase family protein n=1 Tax=Winogradskyella sp. TaxID=1883156 RepID=UPI0017EE0786|nr:metallophosphoesterase family protein [Winogradskyella sp.]
MKIAILSDIHGNFYAFDAVLKQIVKKNIDLYFFLGDQLGYYYDAEAVYDKISELNCHIIAGNHERIFLKYLKADSSYRAMINKKYGSSFFKYAENFPARLTEFVSTLPNKKEVFIDGYRFLLCHGAPQDMDQYIYPDADSEVLEQVDADNYDFIFNGHTHYPMIYVGSKTSLINVGSVGQSRTVGGVANWGIFNTKNGLYEPQNTLYDIKGLENSLDPNEKDYLFSILRRNNNII